MTRKQIDFINIYALTGDKIASYKQAYNSTSTNTNAMNSAANRLLRIPELQELLQHKKYEQFGLAEEKLQEDLKKALLDVEEKRALLAAIATGEGLTTEPSIFIRLKAIDIDNRMVGMYSGKPVTSLDTFLKRIYQKLGEGSRVAGHTIYTNRDNRTPPANPG